MNVGGKSVVGYIVLICWNCLDHFGYQIDRKMGINSGECGQCRRRTGPIQRCQWTRMCKSENANIKTFPAYLCEIGFYRSIHEERSINLDALRDRSD